MRTVGGTVAPAGERKGDRDHTDRCWRHLPPPSPSTVEYALEAVRKGTTVVGVRGKDSIVLGAALSRACLPRPLSPSATWGTRRAQLNAHVLSRRAQKQRAAVEKKTVPKLQEARTVRKIHVLDDHICLAFAVRSGGQPGGPMCARVTK